MHDPSHSKSRLASIELQPSRTSATPAGETAPVTGRASLRVLRQIATTRRRAEAVGRVADRVLGLVEAATTPDDDDPVLSLEAGVVAHPALVERRAQAKRERRKSALCVLLARDAAPEGSTAAPPASILSQSLAVALQAVRLAQELGDRASSLDIERAAALAAATSRASKVGELDARAEAAARAQAWSAQHGAPPQYAPHDGSPPPGPQRLFNSVDRDPDVLDPRDDPLRAYLTVEPEMPDDLPEAPDPSEARPIDPTGRKPGGAL